MRIVEAIVGDAVREILTIEIIDTEASRVVPFGFNKIDDIKVLQHTLGVINGEMPVRREKGKKVAA